MKKLLIFILFILLTPFIVLAEDIIDETPSIDIEFTVEQSDVFEIVEDILDADTVMLENEITEFSNSEFIELTDTQRPTLDSVKKVTFLNRVESPSDFEIAPEKIYKEGPLYYLVSFSEPISGFDAMSLQLANNNCPANPLVSSICGEISTVEPLEVLQDTNFYTDWIVIVDAIQNAGTFFLNFVNHEEGVTDGISDYVMDEAGNYLQPVEFAPHLKAEYNVDTFPLEIDGAPYLDENGILRIPFNKNISSLVFSNPDLAQFSYIYSNSDSELVTPLIPSQADIDGSEFRVTFPGAPKQRVHSLFKYFAQSDLTQIISEAGVKTPSFSIETFTNNTYTVCVDLDNPSCSEVQKIPSTPFVQFVDYIDSQGTIIYNKTYQEGDEVLIRLTFSEDLYITDDFDAALELNTGPITGTGYALYDDLLSVGTPESNPDRITNMLVLRYIVQPNDLSADLDAAIGLLEVWGGSGTDIDEENGVSHEIANYDLFIPAPRTLGSLSDKGEVVIDGIGGTDEEVTFIFSPVTVQEVTIFNPLSLYTLGDSLQIKVKMSGPVIVNTDLGFPEIELNGTGLDGNFIIAEYSPELSDPSNGELIFEYTIKYGDSIPNLNYRFNNAMQLNGATISQSITVLDQDILIDTSASLPDVDGPYSLKGKYSIIIDALPPNSPSLDENIQSITNQVLPTFIGSGEIGATIRIYDSSEELICEVVTDQEGNWSCDSEIGFSEGNYTVYLEQIDSNGNKSEELSEFNITIDTTSPENLTTESNQTVEPGILVFIGTGDPGDTISIFINELEVCSVVIPESGAWECTTEDEYPEGDYSANVVETDLAGNITSLQISFTILAPIEENNEDTDNTDNTDSTEGETDNTDTDDSSGESGNDNSGSDTDTPKSIIKVSSGGGGGGGLIIDLNTYPSKSDTLVLNPAEEVNKCPVVFGYYDIGDRGPGVKDIQRFLNTYEGENLYINGVFGMGTFNAVKRFQAKYYEDILKPWGLSQSEATGFWYISTSKKANSIAGCSTPSVELPTGVIL